MSNKLYQGYHWAEEEKRVDRWNVMIGALLALALIGFMTTLWIVSLAIIKMLTI